MLKENGIGMDHFQKVFLYILLNYLDMRRNRFYAIVKKGAFYNVIFKKNIKYILLRLLMALFLIHL